MVTPLRHLLEWLPVLVPPGQEDCFEPHDFTSRLAYPAPRLKSLKFWSRYGSKRDDSTLYDFFLRRDGDVDIELRGFCLAEVLFRLFRPGRQERGTAVSIYWSIKKKYAAMVQSVRIKDGVVTHVDVSTVGVADTPEELLQWLRDRENGKLGLPSKAAIERASLVDGAFKDLLREQV